MVCLKHGEDPFHADLQALLVKGELDLVVIDSCSQADWCLELLQSIKNRRSDVPVIFVLPPSSDRLAGELYGSGARCCHQRPMEMEPFLEQARMLLRLKQETAKFREPLTARMERPLRTRAHPGAMPETILRTIRYLEAHATDRNLSIHGLARIACMSPFHFCRVFKKFTSRTPMQFVQSVRIERAKQILTACPAEFTIAMIANSLGFYDSSTFNKRFKKMTGLTPTGFRRLNGGSGAH
jgi:AraC-like DNA-binding protein